MSRRRHDTLPLASRDAYEDEERTTELPRSTEETTQPPSESEVTVPGSLPLAVLQATVQGFARVRRSAHGTDPHAAPPPAADTDPGSAPVLAHEDVLAGFRRPPTVEIEEDVLESRGIEAARGHLSARPPVRSVLPASEPTSRRVVVHQTDRMPAATPATAIEPPPVVAAPLTAPLAAERLPAVVNSEASSETIRIDERARSAAPQAKIPTDPRVARLREVATPDGTHVPTPYADASRHEQTAPGRGRGRIPVLWRALGTATLVAIAVLVIGIFVLRSSTSLPEEAAARPQAKAKIAPATTSAASISPTPTPTLTTPTSTTPTASSAPPAANSTQPTPITAPVETEASQAPQVPRAAPVPPATGHPRGRPPVEQGRAPSAAPTPEPSTTSSGGGVWRL